jgi:hypothetical protein
MPVEVAPEPKVATTLFNPAPKHTASEAQIREIVRRHPVAPLDIQAIIDQLVFRIPET